VSYAELHFHVLPDIDDGPPTLHDSIELARASAAEGTRTIVATPHVHPLHVIDPSTLPARVGALDAALRHARLPVRVLCGGELSHEMVGRLSQSQLEAIAHGPAGRRWLLLEASLGGLEESYTFAADELRARGFAVVVAHPERALLDLQRGWPVIEHELAAGSAMQLNAWSVAGLYGERERDNAFRVLRAASLVAIASDAHGPHRPPALELAVDALLAAGEAKPWRLIEAVPNALLAHGLPAPAALAA
jgi:protein-tyrosine phosphatase